MEKEVQPVMAVVDTSKQEKLLSEIREASSVLALQIARAEELKAKNELGGLTDAGQIPPKIDQAEEDRKRINKWLAPTGKSI